MSSFLRQRPHCFRQLRRSRAACALALLCVPLALAQSAIHSARSSRDGDGFAVSRPQPAPAGLVAPGGTKFRLGNAATPLGWSTVVGDFNVDGTADVAVADRLVRRPTGYSYRIQFSISGQAQPDDVTFESTSDALTLRLSDVDADNDLDVIVSAVLSKETVGVWLNDGHGRFTSSNVGHLPAAIRARQTIEDSDPASDPSTIALPNRRTAGGVHAVCRAVVVSVSLDRFVGADGTRVRSTLHSPSTAPRGPPAHPEDFLS